MQRIVSIIYTKFATVDEIVDTFRFCMGSPFVNSSMIGINGGYCHK